jgi:hypothetical protein
MHCNHRSSNYVTRQEAQLVLCGTSQRRMQQRVSVYRDCFNITKTLSQRIKIVFNESLYAYVCWRLLPDIHSWYPWFVSVSCRIAQWVRKCRLTYRAHAAKSRITIFRQFGVLAAGLRPKAWDGRTHWNECFDAIGPERCVCQAKWPLALVGMHQQGEEFFSALRRLL